MEMGKGGREEARSRVGISKAAPDKKPGKRRKPIAFGGQAAEWFGQSSERFGQASDPSRIFGTQFPAHG